MAVAAETQTQIIPELAGDEVLRRRAAEFIGVVATSQYVEAPTEVQPIESLYQAIQLAETGDLRARAMIETNARTDAIERTMKAGHVMSVDLMVDEAGRIQQHGQGLDSIQANSLRFAADNWQMRQRVEAETRNAFRIQHHYEQGDLENYYFVVFSRAADNMTIGEMDRAGFFTDTMSCAIQVTSVEDHRLITESAFVAGVEKPGGERYDEAAVIEVADGLGVDYRGLNAARVLDSPLLVPKSLMLNGAIDLVERWDEARGTFFGQPKPRQDYLRYKRVCAEREARFEPKIQQIVDQLIGEAGKIRTPLMAVQRLNKISAEQMLQQAVGDDDINPMVFGPAAAGHIYKMRQAFQDGKPKDLQYHYQMALLLEQSDSCPGGPGGTGDAERNGNESCTFVSKKCPKCGEKNVLTTSTPTEITGSCGCRVSKSSDV